MKKVIGIFSFLLLVLVLGGCSYKIVKTDEAQPSKPQISQAESDKQFNAIWDANSENTTTTNEAQATQQNPAPVKNDNFDQKSKCITLGEQYYSNYLKDQEHNPMFSFDVYDLSHEVSYSTELNTCLIYVMMKNKDIGEKIGGVRNEFIYDLLNSKTIYSMAYSGSSDNNTVLKMASDFQTSEEFTNKKIELFK